MGRWKEAGWGSPAGIGVTVLENLDEPILIRGDHLADLLDDRRLDGLVCSRHGECDEATDEQHGNSHWVPLVVHAKLPRTSAWGDSGAIRFHLRGTNNKELKDLKYRYILA